MRGSILLILAIAGCGDDCQQLCSQTAARLRGCKSDALTWPDLGARSHNDFIQQCRSDWDLASADLTQSDHQIALEVCHDASNQLDELSCDEVVALYAPLP